MNGVRYNNVQLYLLLIKLVICYKMKITILLKIKTYLNYIESESYFPKIVQISHSILYEYQACFRIGCEGRNLVELRFSFR